MSTELVVALVSSFVALSSIWAGVLNARRADRRAEKQNQADFNKLKAEQAHALMMWRAEIARARQQERLQRLQNDAADYIALLGEVDDITAEMRRYLRDRAEKADWGHSPPPKRWNTEIRGSLATMSARVTLYGGRIAETAVLASTEAVREIENLRRALGRREDVSVHMELSKFTAEFAVAVREHLEELSDDVRR